jgi:8-oxo-dGTP pyrophosphatase MutT (NUDIX family)
VHSAVMSADPVNPADLQLPIRGSRAPQPSSKFFRLAHLRKLRSCQQVAAVCFRIRGDGIEFLLVQTRHKQRWIFPKGSAEPGLTHAQAAALEASEEAGVHGRMEETSFTRYIRRKRGGSQPSAAKSGRSAEKDLVVNACLCEVSRLSPPQESDRNPTWFSVEKAKQRLRQDRAPNYGAELARVVDRAVARIRRLGKASASPPDRLQPSAPRRSDSRLDPLRKVQFIDAAGRTGGAPRLAARNRTILEPSLDQKRRGGLLPSASS